MATTAHSSSSDKRETKTPELGQEGKTMNTELASAGLTAGQLNAIVKKLGGHDSALRFLRDELSVSDPIRSWHEEDGVIYFSVTSDGTTGEDWIKRLEGNGFRMGDYVKQVLRSRDFKPTSGVTTEVVVLKGKLLNGSNRTTKKILAEADKRKFEKPSAEVACLIREAFTDEEITAIGLALIVTMHEPINNPDGDLNLLLSDRRLGGRWLNSYYYHLDDHWRRGSGFAFAVPQVRKDSPRKWTDPIHPGP